jgi:hypothetical protein
MIAWLVPAGVSRRARGWREVVTLGARSVEAHTAANTAYLIDLTINSARSG